MQKATKADLRIVQNVAASMKAEHFPFTKRTLSECRAVATDKQTAEELIRKHIKPYLACD